MFGGVAGGSVTGIELSRVRSVRKTYVAIIFSMRGGRQARGLAPQQSLSRVCQKSLLCKEIYIASVEMSVNSKEPQRKTQTTQNPTR